YVIILRNAVFPSIIFFFQAEDGIRDFHVTGVQTCALPISLAGAGNVKKLTLINHNRPLKHKRHSAYQQLCRRQKQNSPQACACGLSGETLTSWITAG